MNLYIIIFQKGMVIVMNINVNNFIVKLIEFKQ